VDPHGSEGRKSAFHVKHEGLIAEAGALGVILTPPQAERLMRYEALVHERAGAFGMIARGDLDRLRDRHVLDSLRAAPVLGGVASDALDLGSGAGLPGIPVAIALPDLRMTLTETRAQRLGFLELAVMELGLSNISVHAGRAEHVTVQVDACLARAFRDARTCWRVALPLLRPGGRLVYFAGTGFDAARDVPADATATILPASSLAKSGPLVIMTRQ
jgi:16S rRNA (guanine527-N7)-methyltransferase